MNWISVPVAAIAVMAFGFLWYNPKTFGPVWMESIGMTEEQAKKGNKPLIFGLSFIMSMIIAYTFIGKAGHHGEKDQTFIHGIVHGWFAVAWVVIPVLITNLLYEQRSLKSILVNVGYWIISFCLMGAIVFAFYGMGTK